MESPDASVALKAIGHALTMKAQDIALQAQSNPRVNVNVDINADVSQLSEDQLRVLAESRRLADAIAQR